MLPLRVNRWLVAGAPARPGSKAGDGAWAGPYDSRRALSMVKVSGLRRLTGAGVGRSARAGGPTIESDRRHDRAKHRGELPVCRGECDG
jgi:hypothetical protein